MIFAKFGIIIILVVFCFYSETVNRDLSHQLNLSQIQTESLRKFIKSIQEKHKYTKYAFEGKTIVTKTRKIYISKYESV